MRRKHWHHRFIATILLVTSACWFTFSPLGVKLLTQGLVLFLPADTGATTDAIVVLGRGEALRDSRIHAVAELWSQNRGKQVFASGMNDAREITDRLAELGVPRTALEGETCSQTTAENALFTAMVLQPQQIRSVLLVTDDPHMLRSVLVFRRFGFDVIPHPIPIPSYLDTSKKFQLVLREYAGLVDYALKGKFKSQSQTAEQEARSIATYKIQSWKCHIQRRL